MNISANDLIARVAERANALAGLSLSDLRMNHPEKDSLCTEMREAARLADKGDCIEAILLEEFQGRYIGNG